MLDSRILGLGCVRECLLSARSGHSTGKETCRSVGFWMPLFSDTGGVFQRVARLVAQVDEHAVVTVFDQPELKRLI